MNLASSAEAIQANRTARQAEALGAAQPPQGA